MPSKNLNFIMQHQQQDLWCWSAVAVSVSHFFDAASAWTQCTLANQQLNKFTCCEDGGSCNETERLHISLNITGNLRSWAPGAAAFNAVEQEIDADAPVGVRVVWLDGMGHFVAINGYANANGQQYVNIKDPWYGDSTFTYNSFKTAYRGSGTWTHTYYVS